MLDWRCHWISMTKPPISSKQIHGQEIMLPSIKNRYVLSDVNGQGQTDNMVTLSGINTLQEAGIICGWFICAVFCTFSLVAFLCWVPLLFFTNPNSSLNLEHCLHDSDNDIAVNQIGLLGMCLPPTVLHHGEFRHCEVGVFCYFFQQWLTWNNELSNLLSLSGFYWLRVNI